MSRIINPPVHVLVINTNTGHSNVSLCDGEDVALEQLFSYVRRWWTQETGLPLPEKIDIGYVSRYMDDAAESFIITPCYEVIEKDDELIYEEEDDEFIGYSREEELGE